MTSASQLKTVIVGYGNPYCGDDGVGPAAARRVHAELAEETGVGLLEMSTSALELIERLAGYDRAVIIDALVDEDSPVGAVKRLELVAGRAIPGLGFHTAGLGSALAMAKALDMDVPSSVSVYGIVIREPREFQERLGEEMSERLPEIVRILTEAIREEAAQPVPPDA